MGFDTTFRLEATSGADIAVRHEPAAAKPVGIVQICHGLAEHSARYRPFAEALADQGFHVFAHDHRGHGETRAPDAPTTVFSRSGDGASKVISDVLSVRALAVNAHPGLPVVLFGHSMGGLIAFNTVLAAQHAYAGGAIWNANFSGGLLGRLAQAILRYEAMRLGSDVPSRILPKLTFGAWAAGIKDRRTDFDWLSRIEEEVDAYIADPLCGWDASVSMWQDVFRLVFAGADDRRLEALRRDFPLHLRGGGQDPATAMGKAVRDLEARLARHNFTDFECTVAGDGRHETLNDLGREVAISDITGWALRVCREARRG